MQRITTMDKRDMRYRLIIFDFDGTLVDTITDVGICFNQALKNCGLPQHPLERFSSFAGGNLETVVSKMLPADQVTQENIDRVKTCYRSLYLASSKPNSKPYEGMMELLQDLKKNGCKLAVNSNKGQVLLDDMTEKIFPARFFDSVVGYLESRPSKPDPAGVKLIAEQTGCSLEHAVYVGDGESDVQTAQNAGIPCVFVTWGQGSAPDEGSAEWLQQAKNVEQLRQLLL